MILRTAFPGLSTPLRGASCTNGPTIHMIGPVIHMTQITKTPMASAQWAHGHR